MSFSRFENGLFQATGQFIASTDTKPFKDFAKQGELIVAGYATTFDIGLEGAVIARDALNEEDLKQRPTLLFNHDQNRPIGRVVSSKIDDKGLFIVGVIDSTEKELQQKIMSGTLSRFSIRGRIMRSHAEWRKDLQKNIDVIDELKTLEVSVVSVPAVAEAEIQKWYLQRNFNEGGDSMSEQERDEVRDVIEATEEFEDEFELADDGTLELLLGLDERVNDLVDKIGDFEAATNEIKNEIKPVMDKLGVIERKIDEVLKKLEKYPYPYPAKRGAGDSADQTGHEEDEEQRRQESTDLLEEIQNSIQRLASELEDLKRSPVVKGEKKDEKQQSELKRFVESDEYKSATPTDKLRMLYDFLQKGGE